MFRSIFLLIFVLLTSSFVQSDITNLNDFLSLLNQNQSIVNPIGFLSKANSDVVKRYLLGNINITYFQDKKDMLKAIDDETIVGMLNRKFILII